MTVEMTKKSPCEMLNTRFLLDTLILYTERDHEVLKYFVQMHKQIAGYSIVFATTYLSFPVDSFSFATWNTGTHFSKKKKTPAPILSQAQEAGRS